MINVKVRIEQFTPEKGREAINLTFEQFVRLHRDFNRLAGELNLQAPEQKEVDLSNVEQGLLINELCKRSGVDSIITKANKPFSVIAGIDLKNAPGGVGVCETVGLGPANIIIVSNNHKGGNVNGK